MSTVDIRPFEDGDAEGIARLSTTVQWPSLTDPDVVRRVCTAPGASAYVADHEGEVVGWAQALGDGVLQSTSASSPSTPTTAAAASPGCWWSPRSRTPPRSGWT